MIVGGNAGLSCQNLRGIQDDIKLYLPNLLKFQKNKIVFEIEKLLRTYDPEGRFRNAYLNRIIYS